MFPTEVPFYRWESQEGLLKSITEADRGLLAGAMEYVPAHRLAEVLESSTEIQGETIVSSEKGCGAHEGAMAFLDPFGPPAVRNACRRSRRDKG